MSADNFIYIIEEKGQFIGYDCSASVDYPTMEHVRQCPKVFTVSFIREAIEMAQNEHAEYGYHFVSL